MRALRGNEMKRRNNRHLRELKSYVFEEQKISPKFRRFVTKRVLPDIKLSGYKLDEKRELIVPKWSRNLVTTGLAGAVVSDSRDWHTPGAKQRSQIYGPAH